MSLRRFPRIVRPPTPSARASEHLRARRRAPPIPQNCDRCMRPPMWKLASPDDADALHRQHRRADGQRDRRPTEIPEAILSEMKQVRPLLGRDQAHAHQTVSTVMCSCVSPVCGRITWGFLSFFGGGSYWIRILMYRDVSGLYPDCILIIS